jgi:enamine deaminase RidA (YjgF/YER057c/UK114 family)
MTNKNPNGVMYMKKVLCFLLASLVSSVSHADVTRHPLFNDNPFPISRAVEVSPGTTLIFHSGMVPGALDEKAERGSRAYYGDTEAQALNIFARFEESFQALGVGFGDVIKMQVFMVGDPTMEGKMDFAGFMKAYTKYFGTAEQPNKPARSAFQIAGLAGGPNMLIEIEMVIAKPQS